MNAYPTHPAELLTDDARPLYREARSAAHSAFARLGLHPDDRIQDATQSAAIAYWSAFTTKPAHYYARKAARYDAINEIMTRSLYALSLDAPDEDGSDTWLEAIPAPDPEPDDAPAWLDDHDLPALVAATLGRNRPANTIEYHTAILRLLAAGYDTAAIATELGRTEESVKSTRYQIRKRLLRYCAENGIDTDHIAIKSGGWRPAHHYAEMDNTSANAARWANQRKENRNHD